VRVNFSSNHPPSNSSSAADILGVYTASNETPIIVLNSDQVLESSAQEAPSIQNDHSTSRRTSHIKHQPPSRLQEYVT